jgi:hypothetical protein
MPEIDGRVPTINSPSRLLRQPNEIGGTERFFFEEQSKKVRRSDPAPL